METYEIINKILVQQEMTKREFARRLISLEPKSNRTGEIISETTIYAYLNGQNAMQLYLIPYISDVLGIPEQFLFEENEKVRMRLIRYITNSLSTNEKLHLKTILSNDKNIESQNEILDLIKYAPQPLLNRIKNLLEEIKILTETL